MKALFKPRLKLHANGSISRITNTPAEVRAKFEYHGIAISAWAIANNLSPPLVYAVMSGRSRCVLGESYRAAVLLGLKPGNPDNNPKTYAARASGLPNLAE